MWPRVGGCTNGCMRTYNWENAFVCVWCSVSDGILWQAREKLNTLMQSYENLMHNVRSPERTGQHCVGFSCCKARRTRRQSSVRNQMLWTRWVLLACSRMQTENCTCIEAELQCQNFGPVLCLWSETRFDNLFQTDRRVRAWLTWNNWCLLSGEKESTKMILNVTMETGSVDQITELSFGYQDNINTTVITDNNSSVSQDVTQPDSLLPIVFTPPCSSFGEKLSSVVGTMIALIGLVLNGLSLLAFKQMSLNTVSLFLAKCLAVYDSIFLFSFLNEKGLVLLMKMLGFGNIYNTAFEYWFWFMYVLYRIAGPLSFWTVCVITVQR